MGMLYNATNETHQVKAFGNYFEFKPKQMKVLDDRISHWIATERFYLGIVALPEEFADPSFASSEEGKTILAEKTKQGVEAFCQRLRERIKNVEVSLRQDLEKANIKADPLVFASPGEVEAFELLAKYQKAGQDAEEAKVERLKQLQKQIKGV